MKPSEMIEKYQQRLDLIQEMCKKVDIEFKNDTILHRLLGKQYFEIAFVGEFTAGKSSLINAILKEDILPTKLEPTTARVTTIHYAESPAVTLHYRNGDVKSIGYAPRILHDFIASKPEEVANVATIELGYPADFLKDGIVLIDTPGTNDTNEDRVKITYDLLPSVDAVVYLTIHPVTASNLESFTTHILGNQIEQVMVVLNKRDLYEASLEKVTTAVQEHFEKELGIKAHISVVSAMDYLDGVLAKDDGLVQASHMDEFFSQLDAYVKGSSKFESLEHQYQCQLERIKSQMSELLLTRIASLVLPEEIFLERKTKLQSDLAACEKETESVKDDVSAELKRLISKLDDSLDKHYFDMIEQVSMMFDQHQGDVRLLMRNIELMIRRQYDQWRMRNEPIVTKYISNLRGEINTRIGKIAGKMDAALELYRSDAMKEYSSQIQNDKVMEWLTDPTKARTGVSLAAGAATVFATMALGFATGGLALLLVPLGMFLADKKRKEQVAAVKNEALGKMRQDADAFKKSVLQNLYDLDKKLMEEINKTFSSYVASINKQLDDVEENRKKMAKDLDKQAQGLLDVKTKIEAV